MGGDVEQAFHLEVGEDAVHTQTAALRHAQRRLLPAVPLHIPAAGMRRDAQHQQQDRRDFHRPQKESQQPQRDVKGEPQAVHQWVFLGIG